MTETGIILLAAGNSSRMGRPKQLLDFQGKKLIQIVAERLLACRCFPTVVVLGANAGEIAPFLSDYANLNLIQNLHWQSGMASSIHCGIEFLEAMFPSVSHAMIALGDQPFVEVEHYYRLVEAADAHPEQAIAAHYDGHLGAPIVFPDAYWPMLSRLTGDQGARVVVRALPVAQVVRVDVPRGGEDVDWPSDWPE